MGDKALKRNRKYGTTRSFPALMALTFQDATCKFESGRQLGAIVTAACIPPAQLWAGILVCFSGQFFGAARCLTSAKLAPMSVSRQVTIYSRKGCHLCEIIKETLAKLHRRGGFTWSEVDVDSDEQLRRQFTDEVPVVFIDGRKAFKYRMSEQEFLRKLAS
jgi:glutaredoxin